MGNDSTSLYVLDLRFKKKKFPGQNYMHSVYCKQKSFMISYLCTLILAHHRSL